MVDKEGSELSGVEMIRREDGSGHWVARVRLDEGNPLTDSIFGSLRLETRSPNYSFDPSEVELRLPWLECTSEGRPGRWSGWTGCWAIHALVGRGRLGSDGEDSGCRSHPDMSREAQPQPRALPEETQAPQALLLQETQGPSGGHCSSTVDKLGLVHPQ